MTPLCALTLVLSLSSPLVPQGTPRASADPDLRELASYTLTMDTVNKVDRALRSMITELKKDPKFAEAGRLRTELDALRKKDETTEAEDKRIEEIEAKLETLENDNNPLGMDDAKTISDMAAKIQKTPVVASALRREGLTPREYSTFMLAMIQAGFAAGLQKSGLLKETPEGTNPANIKFVLDHEQELAKLQQGWGADKDK